MRELVGLESLGPSFLAQAAFLLKQVKVSSDQFFRLSGRGMALLKVTKCLPFCVPSVGDKDKYRQLFQNSHFSFCHVHAGALKMGLFRTLSAHCYWQVLNILCQDI